MDRQRTELLAAQRARQLAAQRVSENQLTQQQAAQQRADQVRQAVADPNATFDTIRKTGDLDTAEKFRASRQQITEAQRKEAADENEFIARGIGAILEAPDDNTRSESYFALFEQARQRFGDEAIGKLGLTPQYSRALDSRLDMFRRTALTQLQQLDVAGKQQANQLAGQAGARAQQQFEVELPGMQADTASKKMTLEERARNNGLTEEQQRAADDREAARKTIERGQNMVNERMREAAARKDAEGKPLPQSAIKDLEARKEISDQQQSLLNKFQDDFAGNTVTGGLETIAGRLVGENFGITKGQVDFWQSYQDYKNKVRNQLFGSALTPTEQKEWEKAIFDERTNPNVIRTNLARQRQIVDGALQRLSDVYKAGGFNKEQIELLEPTPVAPAGGPKVGTVEDGYEFMGGNPADQKNWKKK